METIDPSTGLPLPADAIQRVLHITPTTHIYQIPPLTSVKGHVAATWTADDNRRRIFTARLRILETSLPAPPASSSASPDPSTSGSSSADKVKVDILLEDPATGQLFAAAPYTARDAVEQALDSSRFFAVRVQGDGGRKAVLGLAFEERSDAFDFSVALQQVRRTLGMEAGPGGAAAAAAKEAPPRDFSLKEGETITLKIGGKGRRLPRGDAGVRGKSDAGDVDLASFSLPPPPPPGGQSAPGGGALLPPPPPAGTSARKAGRNPSPAPAEAAAAEGSIGTLGFDDGEFGEFQ